MKEILKRLKLFTNLEFLIFTDDTILNEPPESWPIVDCLISFYSTGFPLDKAIEYADLRKPLVLNDLHVQYHLQDRWALCYYWLQFAKNLCVQGMISLIK